MVKEASSLGALRLGAGPLLPRALSCKRMRTPTHTATPPTPIPTLLPGMASRRPNPGGAGTAPCLTFR